MGWQKVRMVRPDGQLLQNVTHTKEGVPRMSCYRKHRKTHDKILSNTRSSVPRTPQKMSRARHETMFRDTGEAKQALAGWRETRSRLLQMNGGMAGWRDTLSKLLRWDIGMAGTCNLSRRPRNGVTWATRMALGVIIGMAEGADGTA